MATYLSSEEVRRKYIEVLGPDLGAVFHSLFEEVAWLHDKWREFRELFGTSPERINLLHEAASRFFGHVQDALWEDVLLHISRLTDSVSIGLKENLTIRRLPALIQEPAFCDEVTALVNLAVEKSGFARDWRNRRIAHRDLALALDSAPMELAAASRLLVGEALDALTVVICRVHEHYHDGSVDLAVPGGPGDALDLLRVLQAGLSSEADREARFRDGTATSEDWRPGSSI